MEYSHFSGNREKALQRFAVTSTLITIVGLTVLGFEQAYMHPVVAALSAYIFEIVFETIRAHTLKVKARYSGGIKNLVNFVLPGHISAMACSAFLYPSDLIMPTIFAVAVAIGSKYIFFVDYGKQQRHFFNPSALGILVTLLAFPHVSTLQPYHFTANLSSWWDLAPTVVIAILGLLMNFLLTKRLPLIAAWLVAFVGQGVVRWMFGEAVLFAVLFPATGAVAILFSFFMVSDPGSTPEKWKSQIVFGASVGVFYGVLTQLHVVHGLFWALAATCALRGILMFVNQKKMPVDNVEILGNDKIHEGYAA